MYNRYIPQPDGSYQRNRIQEPSVKQEQPLIAPPSCTQETPKERCADCIFKPSPQRPLPPRQKRNTPPVSIGKFLKNLLPRDFDTEDLLIILLLLLMAGDCQEDQNTALLTLAMYLFM